MRGIEFQRTQMTLQNPGNQGRVGESHLFERLGVLNHLVRGHVDHQGPTYRSGHISTGDALGRGIKEVESG